MKKGSTDLEVIYADKNAVYLQEGHLALKTYFVIGATARESGTLVKLDKNLVEIYRNDFNKELKGKEFIQFFNVQDKLYLFASDYEKKDKTLNIFGAELNKNSGELMSDWVNITGIQKEEKKDEIEFKIIPNADSSRIVIVSTVKGKEKNEYRIQEFDRSLKASAKALTITNEFDPKTFQVQDILYTMNRKTIVVGRVYEYQEGKKKKDKFLDFANYNIRLYDENGKQQKEINTNINGRWLTSTKVMQEKNKDLVLAAFYSTQKKAKTIDGMLVQRLNPVTGDVISTSEKLVNNSLISGDPEETDDDDDENETKAERKERKELDKLKNEGEGFSKYMKFRNIFYTDDNGLIILAEEYNHYYRTSRTYRSGSNGMGGSWSETTYSIYECEDMLMCKVDEKGNIGWLNLVPKSQREVVQVSSGGSGFNISGFFDLGSRPFYAGFGAFQNKSGIQIIFNDNPKNAVVTQAGQKVKKTTRYSKSDCFILTVDPMTGKIERRMFYTNANIPTSMPRLGAVLPDGMYIVGKEDRMLGKTKMAVGRIVL